VASQVERKIDTEVPRNIQAKPERLMCCISSNHEIARRVIRKTARLASYYNAKWFVLYVQTPKEDADNIGLAAQRHLINNFKLATEMGAELVRVKNTSVGTGILEMAEERKISTICIGKPHLTLSNIILRTTIFNHLLKKLSASDIDLVILS
jgi:two-component system sensor histidine kinase KdpD